MMNWKWNMPLQVNYRVYSSQDIFQIITFQCPVFTTGNCSWPRPVWWLQTSSRVGFAVLAASERAPELLHSAPPLSPEWASHLCTSQGVWCKSPTWIDIGKSHGLGGKPYKPKILAVCCRTGISLLGHVQTQENLSPTLFMAHAPTSHTWDAQSWQESPQAPAGLNLPVLAKRGNGTLMRMKYVSRT